MHRQNQHLPPPRTRNCYGKGGDLLGEALGGGVQVRVRVAKAVDQHAQEARREHHGDVLRPAPQTGYGL